MARETGDVDSGSSTTNVGAAQGANRTAGSNLSAGEQERMVSASGNVPQSAVQKEANGLTSGMDTSTNGANPKVAQATMLMPRIAPLEMPRIGPMPNAGNLLGTSRPSAVAPVPSTNESRRFDEDKALHKGKQDGVGVPAGEDAKNPDLKGKQREDAIKDGEDWAKKEQKMQDRRQQRDFKQRMRDGWDRFKNWLLTPSPPQSGDLVA